jgi:hypothetical protein
MPHKFDYFFWDIDEKIIQSFTQYYHVGRALTSRKVPGYLFGYLA